VHRVGVYGTKEAGHGIEDRRARSDQLRAESRFTYLVADAETRASALVDPRADRVMSYLQELGDRGLSLRFVIDTHTHADHLSGARSSGHGRVLTFCSRSARPQRSRPGGFETAIACLWAATTSTSSRARGHTDDSVSLLADGALLTGRRRADPFPEWQP